MTPNQISAASGPTTGVSIFWAGRRDHRQNDERDLEEIEKECQKEDEKVDKRQKSPHPARQGQQHVLKPSVAIDAEKDDGEAG
jgi:hypothetical protein